MSALHNSILDTIGNTPVVRLARLAPEGVALYAKLEAFNPLGSVKDRLALAVIEAAERDGRLVPGQTVIEATSGNTGIGLGGDISSELLARTGEATIPQLFIGGVHVGGAVDALASHDRGELVPLLCQSGVPPSGDATLVGRSYLPKWLAARPAPVAPPVAPVSRLAGAA